MHDNGFAKACRDAESVVCELRTQLAAAQKQPPGCPEGLADWAYVHETFHVARLDQVGVQRA